MKNSLAVLIPTKNRKKLLEKSLESLFMQTTAPDQIIVVNDGSTDETQAFLADLSKVHSNLVVINRDKSGGVNTARNQGIKFATSDWIAFLDDDDEFLPNAVHTMKERLGSVSQDFGLVFFNTIIKNDKEEYEGGFQFNGDDFYDPNYNEVMTKFGLKGDCKPVFLRKIFESGKYWFPETVNGFESITIRKMSRDGIKIRYYKDVASVVTQYGDVEHLSFSAPAKNPKGYLCIHMEDLHDHMDFYTNNNDFLIAKYKEMSKLAIRAGLYYHFFKFLFLAIITRFK